MEKISPYVFPILKYIGLPKSTQLYINKRYIVISKDDVVSEICNVFDISKEEFFSRKCRKHRFVEPRKLYCYIRVFEMGAKKVDVGQEFGTHHTTVIHSCNTYKDLYETSLDYRSKCEAVLRKLGF